MDPNPNPVQPTEKKELLLKKHVDFIVSYGKNHDKYVTRLFLVSFQNKTKCFSINFFIEGIRNVGLFENERSLLEFDVA